MTLQHSLDLLRNISLLENEIKQLESIMHEYGIEFNDQEIMLKILKDHLKD